MPLMIAAKKTPSLAALLLQLFCVITRGSDVSITSESPVPTMDTWKSIMSACCKMAPYTGILCSLAPLPTIRQIARDKTTGVMPLLPYSSMVSNSFVWVMYGTVEQHLKAITSIILLNAVLVFSLPKDRAKDFVGKEGMISFIVLFASPLTALKHVIVSKSAASIPLPFTIASVINCLLWSVVGIFQMRDFYIALPSVMGLCCAVAQLVLKAMYRDRVKVKGSSSILD
eukprot:CCRYP_012459-RB/>CCRYP_012459-RB protein AED:0.40 eAED:0.40 QI:0/0/0.5/1/0/0/2/1176/227